MPRKTLITHPQGYLFVHGSILCAVWMNCFGGINGYVRCPKEHPLHRVHYEDDRVQTLFHDVHGGITYTGPLFIMERPSTEWWIGFDTMHLGDWSPFLEDEGVQKRMNELLEALGFDTDDLGPLPTPIMRDETYVFKECIKMASALMQGEEVPESEQKAVEYEVAQLLKQYQPQNHREPFHDQ